ncbi:hypothetical protein M9194_01425 [Vibrio sp. S4M6]|uniref:hypothetical protein n=1 Tax=Vibrio sinus TaxID=2946865 RepID=UPI00202A807C|nr:hypothetical protein [Vibrio sinus]MCL9780089.1 hypothetical protein [Vibrio sinus]
MYKIGIALLFALLPLQSYAYCFAPDSSALSKPVVVNSNSAIDKASSATPAPSDNSGSLCTTNASVTDNTLATNTNYSAQLPKLSFKPNTTSSGNYWSDWGFKYSSEPFLSDNYSSSHFGLGIWTPNSQSNQSWGTSFKNTIYPSDNTPDLTTDPEAWMMNHGLQLSLGFGNKQSGQPRVRFDYLWHENNDDNVRMQVELPF